MSSNTSATDNPEGLKIPQVLPDGPSIVQAIREHHAAWKAKQG